MMNERDMFEDFFGDLFKNPPTVEEIERRKKEEVEMKKQALEARKQFVDYAMTLPGSENVREDNPVMEIRGGIDETGQFFQRTVTREEFVDEMLDNLFGNANFDNQKNGNASKRR